MSEPIRQHLVPRCYLKQFSQKSKKDWYVDVYDIGTEVYFNTNIKNVCVATEFYTFTRLPDDQKRFLEKFYGSRIEADYPLIYEVLTDWSIKKLDKHLKIKVITFIISQFFRTSKLTNTFNRFWNNVLERGHSMINPDSEDQKLYFDDGGGHVDFKNKTLNDVQRESQEEARENINLKNFQMFYDLAKRRLNNLILVHKLQKHHCLITSDNPVQSSAFMFDPASHFSLPIDNQHLITLVPFHTDLASDPKQICRSQLNETMSELNWMTNNIQQIEKAERHAIGNKAALSASLEAIKNFSEAEFTKKAKRQLEQLETIQQTINLTKPK